MSSRSSLLSALLSRIRIQVADITFAFELSRCVDSAETTIVVDIAVDIAVAVAVAVAVCCLGRSRTSEPC